MDERGRDRLQRAKGRATWPGGKFTLQDAPEVDLRDMTPGERVALVWRLTQDAWASTRESLPSYSRKETPASWVRLRGFQSSTMTSSGVSFDEAWDSRIEAEVSGISLYFLGREALVKNKLAAGRDKDLLDVRALRRGAPGTGVAT